MVLPQDRTFTQLFFDQANTHVRVIVAQWRETSLSQIYNYLAPLVFHMFDAHFIFLRFFFCPLNVV